MYLFKNNLNQSIELAVNKLCFVRHAVKRMQSFGLVTYFEEKKRYVSNMCIAQTTVVNNCSKFAKSK